MPAAKQPEPEPEVQPTVDVDALLREQGFNEPTPVILRWRGTDWRLKPLSAVDPKALTQLGTIEGVLDVIRDAVGADKFPEFPVPRGVSLPNGKTELEVFLDAWTDVSQEASDVGESQPSPNS